MEEMFQLKHYGKLTFFEQNSITAEDRAWYLKRLEREFKEQQEREKNAVGNVSMPSAPSISVPSVSVPRI